MMHSLFLTIVLILVVLNLANAVFINTPEKFLSRNFYHEINEEDGISEDTDKSVISSSVLEDSLTQMERMLFESREDENPKSKREYEVFKANPERNQCDAIDMPEILKLSRQSNCLKPRKRCIEVESPRHGIIQVLPPCLVVDRCEGLCSFQTGHICLPKEIETVSLPVVFIDYGASPVVTECSTVKFEKHLTCRCACPITEENCTSKQIFNRQRCRCECQNVFEMSLCKRKNKKWNRTTCECDCAEDTHQVCSTGAFYSAEECKCIPVEGSAEGMAEDTVFASM